MGVYDGIASVDIVSLVTLSTFTNIPYVELTLSGDIIAVLLDRILLFDVFAGVYYWISRVVRDAITEFREGYSR
jgi:hypothetical protein